MYFKYGEYKVKLVQQTGDVGNSVSVVSDRKKEKSVYNEFLRANIIMKQEMLITRFLE